MRKSAAFALIILAYSAVDLLAAQPTTRVAARSAATTSIKVKASTTGKATAKDTAPAEFALEPVYADGYADPNYADQMGPVGEGCSTCAGGHCGWGHPWFWGTCDMPQHLPYVDPAQGYYYFRPYHYRHISEHQAFMSRAGGDPRNPYSNQIFDKVYEDLARERPEDREPPVEEVVPAPVER